MAQILKGDGKMIFTIFIGAIITVVLLGSIANSVFSQVNTGTATNITVTASAINVSQTVIGRQVLAAPAATVINTTAINLRNFGALVETRTVDGLQTVALTLNDTAGFLAGTVVNLTYTFNPDGFLDDSGSRTINNLIPIFSALAILVFLVVVLFKEGSFAELVAKGRRKR